MDPEPDERYVGSGMAATSAPVGQFDLNLSVHFAHSVHLQPPADSG